MSPGASKLPPPGLWTVASPPRWSAPVPASAQQSDLHSSSLGLWTPSRRLLPQSQPHTHTAGQPGLCCPYPCWHQSSFPSPSASRWLSVSLTFWKLCLGAGRHLVPLPEAVGSSCSPVLVPFLYWPQCASSFSHQELSYSLWEHCLCKAKQIWRANQARKVSLVYFTSWLCIVQNLQKLS